MIVQIGGKMVKIRHMLVSLKRDGEISSDLPVCIGVQQKGTVNVERKVKRNLIRTPVFSAKVALRADSATIDNHTQNNETDKACHLDQAENELH
jgi:hypothetical protein